MSPRRILVMCLLTSIWLCVQSPWAHAQRMQAEATAVGALVAGGEEPPCHGAEHAPDPGSATATDSCCDGGHCDGHCAQLSWAMPAAPPLPSLRGMPWPAATLKAGLQSRLQPEPFRPPI